MRRLAILSPLLVAGIAFGVAATTGEVVTPARWPMVPGPEECRVAPRPADEVQRLIGTPAPGEQGGGPIDVPAALPEGTPAGATTVAAVVATMRELLACVAAGDHLRAYALVSDAYLAGLGPLDPLAFATLGTPAPLPPGKRAALLGVWDERVLSDGRVGALVTIGNRVDPDPAPGRTMFVVFARQGDRWLIDEVIEYLRAGPVAQVAGTPPTGGWRPAAAPGVNIEDYAVVIVVSDGVELREVPDANAPVVARVPAGAELEVYGPAVEADGRRWRPVAARLEYLQPVVEGYVPEDAIAVVVPPASPAATQ